ncbi:hypothetical protein GGH91_002079, partial [Coemansia sp. RSA 2671]
LPLHIVKIIVDHVVGSSRLALDGVCKYLQEYEDLLKPLQWVSRNFRAIAFSALHSHGLVSMIGPEIENNLVLPISFGNQPQRVIRNLEVELDERLIHSGQTLDLLALVPCGKCVIPFVQTLTFLFVSSDLDPNEETNWVTAEAHINAFVYRIKLMVPRVSEIKVRPRYFGHPFQVTQHFGSLITQLFNITGRIDYTDVGNTVLPVELSLERIVDLTRIKLTLTSGTYDSGQFMQLTRQSAATLQIIDIESRAIAVCDLVRDSAGSYVTYPSLFKLRVVQGMDSNTRRWLSISNDVVLFPRLRSLFVRPYYSFVDDAAFRGNANVLESLDLMLDGLTVSMLHQRSVFSANSHPKLQQVNLVYFDGYLPDCFTTLAEYMRFALSIGPMASARGLSGVFGKAGLMPVLPLIGNHPCIQVLSLLNVPVSFWDVINLVKLLPLLTDFYAYLQSIGTLPSGVAKNKLVNYVRSTYAPMSRRFRCWHLKCIVYVSLEIAVRCVLLLALACPNMDYAAIAPPSRVAFMELMKKAIDSREFQPYAPRLRRLLFDGPLDC